MYNFILNINPIILALIATTFTFLITVLGSSFVFVFKKVNKNIMDAMLGMAAGIMIAATFFSLLSPAITLSNTLELKTYMVISIGFILGGYLLFIGDKIFNKVYKGNNSKKRIFMLVSSITLHNIPEGLAVGVAFGSIIYHIDGATLTSAMMLALGIGIQNFPEGTAVSVPLRREGVSRFKSFVIGSLSALVEPASGVLGALLVLKIRLVLPYLLSFAAGAMIYVVVDELIPESLSNKKKELMALFTIIGFTIMMILDVALV